MQGSGSRAERIADHIKDEVSQLLSFEVKDPAVGLLTVTHVTMTSDMGLAHVYYTLVGDEVERRKTAKALERATPFVRRRLAESMNLRRAPDVRFQYDENIERQERVESLLRQIARGKIDHDPILRADEPAVDDRPLDAMRAFLDRRLGQSDQRRFGHCRRRQIDFNLDRHRFDTQKRERFEIGEHGGG